MARLLSDATWKNYQKIIQIDSWDTFAQETIIWIKAITTVSAYMEDTISDIKTQEIPLRVLMHYNFFRTWPATEWDITGSTDAHNAVAIFSMKYLNDMGYINSKGAFIMDEGFDKFRHNGILYKPGGFTFTSQADDRPLLLYIILTRDMAPTGGLNG